MNGRDGRKNGKLRLTTDGNRFDRRGRQRSPRHTAAELDLETRIRTAFTLHAVRPDGSVVSRAVQEIRDGRGRPFSVAARRAVEMHEAGARPESFLKIVEELVAWHNEHFPDRAA